MYATLPKNSKPSKSASKDQTRPVLTHAELRETTRIDSDAGERVADGWELVTCDSYQLARVRLSVTEEESREPLTAGPISSEALKAIEKTGSFRANSTIEPCNERGVPTGLSFARPDVGTFPNWDQLAPDVDPGAFSIGLDAELLYSLAQSLGAKQRGRCHVSLTFVTGKDGMPNALRPITVKAKGNPDASGILMPVRLDN